MRISLLLTLSLLCLGLTPQGELVVARPGTGLYHRPGCDVVRGATDLLAMTVGQAEARGYKSHPDCDPSVARPTPPVPQAPPEAKGKRTAPIYVFVNEAGTRYHREGCRTLEKPPKKVLLDAATAKKYWPCHICRPPILPRAKK